MPIPPDSADSEAALRERAQYWIARLAARDISETELDMLEGWLAADQRHAHAFARERRLWQSLDGVADAFAGPASAGPVIPLRPKDGFRLRRFVRLAPAALVASIIAVFILPPLTLTLRADHRTPAGEVRLVSLPDGTTAMLDTDSAISLAFDGDQRTVHLLEGRVWFDVQHESRPFLVEAKGVEAHDIGTGFEVTRVGGVVEVEVTEGAVQVRAPGDDSGPTLHTGDRVRYTGLGLEALSGQAAGQSWRRGELQFDSRPLQSAITEIARYRQAPVWMFGDFNDAPPVSGLFLTGRPDEALETIARMRGLRMTVLPGGLVIIRSGSAA